MLHAWLFLSFELHAILTSIYLIVHSVTTAWWLQEFSIILTYTCTSLLLACMYVHVYIYIHVLCQANLHYIDTMIIVVASLVCSYTYMYVICRYLTVFPRMQHSLINDCSSV